MQCVSLQDPIKRLNAKCCVRATGSEYNQVPTHSRGIKQQ
jgi:hypothetical protein